MSEKEPFELQSSIEDLCFDVLDTIENVLETLHPGKTYEELIYGFKREASCIKPCKNTLMTLNIEAEASADTKYKHSRYTERTTYVVEPETDQMVKITGTFSNQIMKALGKEKTDKLACSIIEIIFKTLNENTKQ